MSERSSEHRNESRELPRYSRVRIGRGLALVGEFTFALVDPDNGRFGERLWALIEAGAGVDELLEELSAAGLRSLGDFAMAQVEDDGIRIVIRGRAEAKVSIDTSSSELRADGVRTWVEEEFVGADGFILSIGPSTEQTLPYRLERGLVPADQLQWSSLRAESPQLKDLDMSPVEDVAAVELVPSSLVVEVPTAEMQAELVASDDAERNEPAVPSIEDREPDDYDYDSLYGHTRTKSVQGAAVSSMEDSAQSQSEDVAETLSDGASGGITQAPPADRGIAPRSDEPGEGLIHAVPSNPVAETSGSLDLPLGDHDGYTVSKAQLQELRAKAAPENTLSDASTSGSQIQALVCSANHANPPQVANCRVCAAPLEGAPVMVPRPVLGRLSFSSGQVVELDRPAIIGRNPKVEGRMANEVPALVKLDIGQALSRSHAMVRLEGWQVLLDDLGSANGTIVTLPGREPQRLHSGEPILLETSTTIDFGGEVTATYEVAT